ncbi:MAG: hypothetical protein HYU75_09585 [Betaproteobacteria bacterium]|nr:hypothetical protein [Betaproteobacteria bacterium]
MAPEPMFGEITSWRSALRARAAVFAALAPGSRIGLVAESAVGNGQQRGSRMLIWQASETGIEVLQENFPGFETTDVDILIAADPAALASLEQALEGDLFARMRKLIRAGDLLFFARKTRRDLEEAGYDDLLEELGFAYLGACR